jgi:uncharacterized OB-fold protein
VSDFTVIRDERSAPFFDATAEGCLLIRRCPVCGAAYPPQARRCSDSDELEWMVATGEGTLVTWAVDHVPPLDATLGSPDGVTSALGIIQLTEGPWMQVPIIDPAPASLSEGMAMRVQFIRPGGGEAIPAFTRQ